VVHRRSEVLGDVPQDRNLTMRDLGHRLAFLAMRMGMAVVGAVPYRLAIALGEWGGRVFALAGTGRRAMVVRHARRLGVAPERIDRHVRQVFTAYGRYWAEALWVRPRRQAEIQHGTTAEGLERIVAARDAGTGMIYALPHLGNWEFAAPVATALGIEVVAVAENLRNRHIRDWFVRMRNELGIHIVLATGSLQVMRALEAAIARNAAVALLCDRDLRGRGVPVEFFGEETTLPVGPISLAIRTGAPVFPVGSYFDGAGHRVVVHPAVEIPEGDDRTERIRTGTQRLASTLEQLILAAPEQWHMLQPNWPSDRGDDSAMGEGM
jgi:lauroyl/myristoyl acyltransferase